MCQSLPKQKHQEQKKKEEKLAKSITNWFRMRNRFSHISTKKVSEVGIAVAELSSLPLGPKFQHIVYT